MAMNIRQQKFKKIKKPLFAINLNIRDMSLNHIHTNV